MKAALKAGKPVVVSMGDLAASGGYYIAAAADKIFVNKASIVGSIGVVGGNSNAFTSYDQTAYVNTIPASNLEMALYLEADRMSSFKVNDEIYRTERKVVAAALGAFFARALPGA